MDPKELEDNKVTEPTPDVVPETQPVTPEIGSSAAEPSTDPTPPAEPKYSDKFRERMKGSYPDEDFTDDENYFKKAIEELENLKAYQNQNIEANTALVEIFNAEPAVKDLLIDMVAGASFREAIARNFSPEELIPAEGDPDREGWKRNSEARSKKLKDNELANKTKMENDEFSAKEINEFAKENNLTPEKANEILTSIGETLDEVYSGKISRKFLNSMFKALNYDSDVANANETGKIAGRNEQIATRKEEKPKGDGLPVMNNSGKTETSSKPATWMDSMLANEKKKQILK